MEIGRCHIKFLSFDRVNVDCKSVPNITCGIDNMTRTKVQFDAQVPKSEGDMAPDNIHPKASYINWLRRERGGGGGQMH